MFSVANVNHFKEVVSGPWTSTAQTDYRVQVTHLTANPFVGSSYEPKGTIHVTGQGSQSKDKGKDWRDDFDFRIRQPAEQWFSDNKEIKIHAGFLRQYKNVRNILMDLVCQYPDYKIRVDGYSLGASWTQLFVQDVLYRYPYRDIQAVLYEPGNPWRKLPKLYKILLKKHVTFVRSIWDPVTWMRLLGFFRYGKTITIGKWWRIWPCQHLEDQVIRNLEEKFK
jgi:hypothetical protein